MGGAYQCISLILPARQDGKCHVGYVCLPFFKLWLTHPPAFQVLGWDPKPAHRIEKNSLDTRDPTPTTADTDFTAHMTGWREHGHGVIMYSRGVYSQSGPHQQSTWY